MGGSRRSALAAATLIAIALALVPRGSAATVEEQRARLPPAAACPDPVEGTWQALKYDEQYRDWYEHTLQIRRTEPRAAGALEGEMTAHYWSGTPADDKPPACAPGRRELVVKMPGKGLLDDRKNLRFGATTYAIDRVICGAPGRYNPDNFSGTIETERNEFQSVNNDGGRSVNEPMVFRRIRCLDAPQRGTQKAATPPAFAPPKRSWGCGR
jgi:hypothetical protein